MPRLGRWVSGVSDLNLNRGLDITVELIECLFKCDLSCSNVALPLHFSQNYIYVSNKSEVSGHVLDPIRP